MGTRSLVVVQVDNKYKVAQYCQWDGFPSGVGVDCLNFLQMVKEQDGQLRFIENLRNCRFYTKQELEQIYKTSDEDLDEEIIHVLSRGTGPRILEYIFEHGGVTLQDESAFAAESLFCEWAYVIDYDHDTFEVYKGFNKKPLTQNDRFYTLLEKSRNGYYPVVKIAQWSLDDLPTEKEFVAHFN